MKDEKDILNHFKKSEKPEVPQGFFDSFSDELMSKIDGDSFLHELPKTDKPEVPEGFFDSFADKMTQSIKTENVPVKKGKIIPMRIFLAVASVAAMLTFVVLTTKQNEQPVVIAETIVEELADEDYDDYLAYLDESTMVDYIVENDLDIDDETDIDESIYNEIESELDDYYYGL